MGRATGIWAWKAGGGLVGVGPVTSGQHPRQAAEQQSFWKRPLRCVSSPKVGLLGWAPRLVMSSVLVGKFAVCACDCAGTDVSPGRFHGAP